MKKSFDCIAMKREAAARIYEKTKDMTLEEQVAYWKERTRILREEQAASREKARAPKQVSSNG